MLQLSSESKQRLYKAARYNSLQQVTRASVEALDDLGRQDGFLAFLSRMSTVMEMAYSYIDMEDQLIDVQEQLRAGRLNQAELDEVVRDSKSRLHMEAMLKELYGGWVRLTETYDLTWEQAIEDLKEYRNYAEQFIDLKMSKINPRIDGEDE